MEDVIPAPFKQIYRMQNDVPPHKRISQSKTINNLIVSLQDD